MKVTFLIAEWWQVLKIVGWTVCPLIETFNVIRMYIKTQFVIENSENDFKIQYDISLFDDGCNGSYYFILNS